MDQQTQQTYQKVATSIGNRILKDAIRFDNCCNWQGSLLEPVRGDFQIINRTFGADFYNGVSGIVWFLSELYQYSPAPLLMDTISGAINTIKKQLKLEHNELTNLALYSGKIGVAYALLRTGNMLNNEEWRQSGLQLFEELLSIEPQEQEIDVISGVAGAIPVLLKVYELTDDNRFLNQAANLGNFLLSRASSDKHKLFWPQAGSASGLTGYSHGNSGNGLALLELAQITGNDTFKQAAMSAFQFEREHYSPHHQNWPDLRELNKTPAYNHMWCHGAPGIAISRMRAWVLTQDNSFLDEAKNALESTYTNLQQLIYSQPQMVNYSLCHGAAGNAQILNLGSYLLKENRYAQLAHQVAQFGIQQCYVADEEWTSGVHDSSGKGRTGEMTPGLMLGLSGTGLFYLHMSQPTPSESPLHIR